MDDFTNILNTEDEINEDELMNYLNKNSSNEEQHNVEQKINNSSFINDAVDGLEQFSSTQKVNSYVTQLNSDLHKKLNKKTRLKRKGIGNLSWEIIGIALILLLCIIAFVLIEMMKH